MIAKDFAEWEARQPLAFGLMDGVPVRLPEANQGPSRLARVRHVAGRVMPSEEAVEFWMTGDHHLLGGQRPDVLAAGSEDGCQRVLRLLVVLGRVREAMDAC